MSFVPSMTVPAPNIARKNNSDGSFSFTTVEDPDSVTLPFAQPAADASSVSYDVNELYEANRVWAEEQAQKQMDFQTDANKIAMDFSAAEAQKERAFQMEMANTAWQRAVKDMKAAGLNPILAYSQGGAAVPSVSNASGVTSAGSMAQMADTGYTSHRLKYAYTQMLVNAAVDVFGAVMGKLPNVSSSKGKIGF